jgi:hypothetical protein
VQAGPWFLLSPCVRDKQRSVGELVPCTWGQEAQAPDDQLAFALHGDSGAAAAREEASIQVGAVEVQFTTPTQASLQIPANESILDSVWPAFSHARYLVIQGWR